MRFVTRFVIGILVVTALLVMGAFLDLTGAIPAIVPKANAMSWDIETVCIQDEGWPTHRTYSFGLGGGRNSFPGWARILLDLWPSGYTQAQFQAEVNRLIRRAGELPGEGCWDVRVFVPPTSSSGASSATIGAATYNAKTGKICIKSVAGSSGSSNISSTCYGNKVFSDGYVQLSDGFHGPSKKDGRWMGPYSTLAALNAARDAEVQTKARTAASTSSRDLPPDCKSVNPGTYGITTKSATCDLEVHLDGSVTLYSSGTWYPVGDGRRWSHNRPNLAAAGSTGSGSASSGRTSTSGCRANHVVKARETLFSIGQIYDVPWKDIRSANGIGANNVIKVNESLCIP